MIQSLGDLESLSDSGLAARATGPDSDAFDDLYRRHCQPGWRFAQAMAPTLPEAGAALTAGFAWALQGARGHCDAASQPFRPTLLAGIYRCAFERPECPEIEGVPSAQGGSGPVVILNSAFRSLPDRWRAAL
jgi:hypothetical protein